MAKKRHFTLKKAQRRLPRPCLTGLSERNDTINNNHNTGTDATGNHIEDRTNNTYACHSTHTAGTVTSKRMKNTGKSGTKRSASNAAAAPPSK